jgi:branched-subunit amino acid aminotransferase/4-amino-4-deoxychorismate lyase
LRAADSWLVDEGRVRGWDLHWQRFAIAAAQDVSALRARLTGGLPATGRWFPRVQCSDDGELSWQLREAPARLPEVTCLAEPAQDPRAAPRAKGPDLDALVALRAGAAAGEVLLAGPDGTIREGSLSSLLWWDGEVLCAVDDAVPILDGVTRRLLLGLARESGVAVSLRRPVVADLAGREVWLTSALHGIRAVSAWLPDGPEPGAATRARHWQPKLEACARILA